MTSAAVYARVSSARQAKDETIGSQLAALREHAAASQLDVPQEWVFADEGHSGATLVRPGLEALRDLAAQGCLDVVLVYSPDRLARKFAYQALLIEELARCGVRVEFVKGPRGDSPEDQLLIQFQGMFAEYEKAQLAERYRRGKAWRAKTGSVNVLSGAPFGYRYVRKTPESGARYEVVPHEAVLVSEMFRRYADEGAAIADLRRWLTDQGVRTRTGKERWDRSVIWGMLRNPAYAGTAVFGKTQAVHEAAGLNRTARLAGRTVPRQVRVEDRPREEWTAIPVPALVDRDTFDRVQQRLEDNKRFAARNTKVPSLLQGLAACASCGYGYYRTSTTTSSGKKIYYYRCLGSDDYRHQGGRVCGNKPVRADYVDAVIWDHVTGLLADPALIRTEIDRRLERARTSDPVTKKRGQLEQALAKTSASIAAMVTAFSEQLITIDELRARMPDLRARETGLKDQIAALDAQAADRDAYLKLADDLEGFLGKLRANSATATTEDRQRVLRALVQDILIGPEKLTIRHRIPVREPSSGSGHHDTTDTEGDMRKSSQLRWGRGFAVAQQRRPRCPGRALRPGTRRPGVQALGACQAPPPRSPEPPACPVRGRLGAGGRGHQGRRPGPARGSRTGARPDRAAPVGGKDPDHPHRRGPGLLGLAHPAPPQEGHGPALRLYLPVQEGAPRRHGQGQDDLPAGRHEPSAGHPPAPDQSGAAGMDHVLPSRSVERDLPVPGRLCLAPGDRMDLPQARRDQPEGAPPPLLRRRMVAQRPGHGTVPHRGGTHDPVPLPGIGDPLTLAAGSGMRTA